MRLALVYGPPSPRRETCLAAVAVRSRLCGRPIGVSWPGDSSIGCRLARVSPALPLVGGGHTRFNRSLPRWRHGGIAAAVEAAPTQARLRTRGPQFRILQGLMPFVLATISPSGAASCLCLGARHIAGRFPGVSSPNPCLNARSVRTPPATTVVSSETFRRGARSRALGSIRSAMEACATYLERPFARPNSRCILREPWRTRRSTSPSAVDFDFSFRFPRS